MGQGYARRRLSVLLVAAVALLAGLGYTSAAAPSMLASSAERLVALHELPAAAAVAARPVLPGQRDTGSPLPNALAAVPAALLLGLFLVRRPFRPWAPASADRDPQHRLAGRSPPVS